MGDRTDVWHGTFALIVLKTLETRWTALKALEFAQERVVSPLVIAIVAGAIARVAAIAHGLLAS